MLSNGVVRDLLAQGVIAYDDTFGPPSIGQWGIILHLEHISAYPDASQLAARGRYETIYPIEMETRDGRPAKVEVLQGKPVVIESLERIGIPPNLFAEVKILPTMASAAAQITPSPLLNDGVIRPIECVVANLNEQALVITPNLPFAEVVFFQVQGMQIAPDDLEMHTTYEVPHEAPPWIEQLQR